MTDMNRITGHHAASGYTPSKEALKAYHRLIDGDGKVINGDHAISDNAPGRPLTKGAYAAHTWYLNTANIGVAILAMAKGLWANPQGGTKYPVQQRQVDAYIKCVAKLAIDYSIAVDKRFILTHAEVQPTLGVTQKNKWDFDYDPRYLHDSRDPIRVGDELRVEIKEAMRGLTITELTPSSNRVMRQGDSGDDVKRLQQKLRAWIVGNTVRRTLVVDGLYGPKTRDAVINFQKKHELLPDGIAGPMTLLALGIAS